MCEGGGGEKPAFGLSSKWQIGRGRPVRGAAGVSVVGMVAILGAAIGIINSSRGVFGVRGPRGGRSGLVPIKS